MDSIFDDNFLYSLPASGCTETVGSTSPVAGATYSPEYVCNLLGQLESTLTSPNAWSRMTLDELVAVAETLVRLDCKLSDTSLLHVIDSLITENCTPESVDAKNLSKLLNSYAHLGFLNGKLIEFLKKRQSLSDMEPCHISGIMFALGKLKMISLARSNSSMEHGPSELLPALSATNCVAISPYLTPSELNNVLVRLCGRCCEIADRFSPLEISTVVFALARLNYRNIKLLNVFSDMLANRIMESSPQIISNTIYAMGKLRFKSTRLLDTVCLTCPSRLFQFKPQELANLVYAFGQLEYRNDEFLSILADHIPPRLSTFKPQELSITAYAYSQLRVSHARMFSGIAIQIARRISECSPQAISNTVYAMSKVNFRHNGLLTALSLSLPNRLHELTPQHISNIMYSFGKLSHRDDNLLDAICCHVPKRLWEFRPQNIANTVYATGKLGYLHVGLLSAVAEHLPYRLSECVSQDISNIVYSFGQLGYRDDHFFETVKNFVFGKLISTMQQKDLSYLVSAFRKVGIYVDLIGGDNQQVVVLDRSADGGAKAVPQPPAPAPVVSNGVLSALLEWDAAALACNVDILSCLEDSGSSISSSPIKSVTSINKGGYSHQPLPPSGASSYREQ